MDHGQNFDPPAATSAQSRLLPSAEEGLHIPVGHLIVSHIFSWTRGGFFANLFSCWLRAVTFPKRRLREFVRG